MKDNLISLSYKVDGGFGVSKSFEFDGVDGLINFMVVIVFVTIDVHVGGVS